MDTLEDRDINGIRIRLCLKGVAQFSLIYEAGNLAAIAYQTTDFSCARILFDRSVALAQKNLIAHPAWRLKRQANSTHTL